MGLFLGKHGRQMSELFVAIAAVGSGGFVGDKKKDVEHHFHRQQQR